MISVTSWVDYAMPVRPSVYICIYEFQFFRYRFEILYTALSHQEAAQIDICFKHLLEM